MKSSHAFLAGVWCFFLGASVSFSQETRGDAREEARDAWSGYYAAQLPRYKFSLASSPDEPLDQPDAKLRWSNPLRPGTHGDLYVWSHKGRGVLVGSIFSYPNAGGRRVAHQFQSLTTETIRCEYTGGSDFQIPGPGLKFVAVPGAPSPGSTSAYRLTQMRSLARRFEASGMNKNVSQPLRALAQPIYRFEGKEITDDGAIFAFVMGTDPELLLVISALETIDGPRWHYAAARFAADPLSLTYEGATIWEFVDTSKHPGYINRHGIDQQPNVPVIE